MRKFSYIMLLLAVIILVLPGMAFAEEAAQVADAATSGGGMQNFAELVFGSGMVKWFKDGGWAMWPIIIIALYGLAYVIWKFIALIHARINVNAFMGKIVPLVKEKKYAEAAEIAKETRGPVAAIIYSGLLKADGGIEAVEKAIENAAMIEMSYLEKGFLELSTAITLAPMMGFLGTVAGMISAFDAIAAARAVDATIVASGIKIALITTEFGLIVAIPVQFFNNIFVTMVDGMVIDMQKATEQVIDAML
ncbi:MAG: MotA/TolQ/ExbB proton channel family protein [Candidatus Cloacimonadaceae bacterium]